jgi:hypothetical protein
MCGVSLVREEGWDLGFLVLLLVQLQVVEEAQAGVMRFLQRPLLPRPCLRWMLVLVVMTCS